MILKLKELRLSKIEEYIRTNKVAKVEDLAEIFDVTPMTIRRDLQCLEEQHIVTRTFGGAMLRTPLLEEASYKEKEAVNTEIKKKIARHAVSYIKDNDIIILDGGTTNIEIAKCLEGKNNLTIVTNDINIAYYITNFTDIDLIVSGGNVQRDTGYCLGNKSLELFKDIQVDIAFMGTSSIDIEHGLTTPNLEKAYIKRQIMQSSKRTILVTDSSKFGEVKFAKICDTADINLIITDRDIDQSNIDMAKKKKIKIDLV